MGHLQQLANNLWVYSLPPAGRALPIGGRTTIVRLSDAALWVHSPCPGAAALQDELKALGSVRYLIAPNQFHHMHMAQWHRAYPTADIWTAPGMQKRLGEKCNFPVHAELGAQRKYPWQAELDQLLIQGAPKLQETVFCHRASRSLILTDIAFNIHGGMHALGATLMRLNGAWRKFGPSRVMKYAFTKDRSALRQSIRTISQWDFDRIVPAHGDVIETDGKQIFHAAYHYLT